MNNERNDGDLISRKALKIALDWIIDNPYVEFDKEIMEEIDEVPAVNPCKNCDLYFKAMTKEEQKGGEENEDGK